MDCPPPVASEGPGPGAGPHPAGEGPGDAAPWPGEAPGTVVHCKPSIAGDIPSLHGDSWPVSLVDFVFGVENHNCEFTASLASHLLRRVAKKAKK